MIRRSTKTKKQNKTQRHFKGVWIPREIWLSTELTWMEKLFIVEIDSLDNGKVGCFASNRHFSEFFNLSISRCSQIITSLADKGFVRIKLNKKGKQITKRSIFINKGVFRKLKGGIQFSKGGYLENDQYNSTGYNNTVLVKEKYKKENLGDFEKWYKSYPKKVAKQAAKKAWIKIQKLPKKERPSFDTLLSAVKEQSQSDQWKDKQYIPNPSTWLNQGRWDDEIIVPKNNNKNNNSSIHDEDDPDDIEYQRLCNPSSPYYGTYNPDEELPKWKPKYNPQNPTNHPDLPGYQMSPDELIYEKEFYDPFSDDDD
jgi:hypothetical protein